VKRFGSTDSRGWKWGGKIAAESDRTQKTKRRSWGLATTAGFKLKDARRRGTVSDLKSCWKGKRGKLRVRRTRTEREQLNPSLCAPGAKTESSPPTEMRRGRVGTAGAPQLPRRPAPGAVLGGGTAPLSLNQGARPRCRGEKETREG